MHLLCKKSTDCASGDVCDRQKHECRASKRKAGPNKASFAKICLTKGIPIEYERGKNKGHRKSKDAMRQCKHQNDRNGAAPYRASKLLGLPAPARVPTPPRVLTPPHVPTPVVSSIKQPTPVASAVASAASPFVRPKEAELKNMKKDQLERLYRKGQNNGYINPDKPTTELTNKQLANAILRATKKQY